MSNIITSTCKRQLCRHVFSGSRYFDSVKMTSDMCGIKTFQGQELQNRFIKSKSRTKKTRPAVSKPTDIASLLKPIPYTVSTDAGVVGQELTGELKKGDCSPWGMMKHVRCLSCDHLLQGDSGEEVALWVLTSLSRWLKAKFKSPCNNFRWVAKQCSMNGLLFSICLTFLEHCHCTSD